MANPVGHEVRMYTPSSRTQVEPCSRGRTVLFPKHLRPDGQSWQAREFGRCVSWLNVPTDVPAVELMSAYPSGQLTSRHLPSSATTQSPTMVDVPSIDELFLNAHVTGFYAVVAVPGRRRRQRAPIALSNIGCPVVLSVRTRRTWRAALRACALLIRAGFARNATFADRKITIRATATRDAFLKRNCPVEDSIANWTACQLVDIATATVPAVDHPNRPHENGDNRAVSKAAKPGRTILAGVRVWIQDVLRRCSTATALLRNCAEGSRGGTVGGIHQLVPAGTAAQRPDVFFSGKFPFSNKWVVS
eukprot:566902-Rhodomonas_salina.2